MKFFPKDKYGRISAIQGRGWSAVWDWPRGQMARFFWNYGGGYRVGPITVWIDTPTSVNG